MLDKRVSIDAALYFKIKVKNSDGGYCTECGRILYEDVKNINKFDSDEVERNILGTAALYGVPKECVSIISKEEYKEIARGGEDERN